MPTAKLSGSGGVGETRLNDRAISGKPRPLVSGVSRCPLQLMLGTFCSCLSRQLLQPVLGRFCCTSQFIELHLQKVYPQTTQIFLTKSEISAFTYIASILFSGFS